MYSKVEKIYFDMDNTIADFSQGLVKICGIQPIPQEQSTPELDDAMWTAVRNVGDFYYRLEECALGMDLLKRLKALFGEKVEILTAVPKERRGITSAEEDKRRWVKEHIGSDIAVNIVHSASEKAAYAGPDCYLIDDLSSNIEEWRKSGGYGILIDKNDRQSLYEQIENSALIEANYLMEKRSCPDCESEVQKGQRYCQMCGADIRAAGGPIIDYRAMMCLYGPPPDFAKVECPKCHQKWQALRKYNESNPSKRFCSKCGTCIEPVVFKD